MKLTKDDFARSEHGITFDREFDNPEEVIDQILKNQEIVERAEQLVKWYDRYEPVIERLKKRIEVAEHKHDNGPAESCFKCVLYYELQEILKDEKTVDTPSQKER